MFDGKTQNICPAKYKLRWRRTNEESGSQNKVKQIGTGKE